MKNKLIIILLAIIILIILFNIIFFYLKLIDNTVKEEKIKIGVILPLTGSAANYGEYVKNGIELARKEINDKNLEIIYEDSQMDVKSAISAYHNLVDVQGFKMIIGDVYSSATLALAPLAEKDKVILFTPASAANSISEAGDYIFRDHVKNDDETRKISEYLNKRYENIAIIYDSSNEAFLQSEKSLKGFLGKDRVFSYPIKREDGDFRTELTKLKENQNKIDAIYITTLSSDGVNIVKQLKELGIDKPILADKTFGNQDFINAAGMAANDIIYAEPDFNRKTNSEFWNSYLKEYNKNPSFMSAQGYDVLKILYSLSKNKCGDDTDCIKNGIYALKDYPGAAGNTTFDKNGDAIKHLVLMKINNGKIQRLEE